LRPAKSGRASLGEHVEIICASFGDLIVHGDWEPVVFGRHCGGSWRGKIGWIGSSSIGYAQQKARLGTGEDLEELDPEECIRDILDYRQNDVIPADLAREAYDLVKRWNDLEGARNIIAEYNSELYAFGALPTWAMLHAWSAVRRLDELLDAEESNEQVRT
jgi:hypothetical protein